MRKSFLVIETNEKNFLRMWESDFKEKFNNDQSSALIWRNVFAFF